MFFQPRIFISSLYDDKYVITFNYKNKSKTVTFEEIESSSLTSKGSPIVDASVLVNQGQTRFFYAF